jgi:RNA polymerase sigma-70 factor (ECF subfamily)
VADYYRKRERVAEVELSDSLPSSKESDPSQQVMLKERQGRLMTAIQQLSEEQRDVILMRFMEGIDIQGVAKAINKTPGAVKALQFRAVRALAEMMQDFSLESTLGVED